MSFIFDSVNIDMKCIKNIFKLPASVISILEKSPINTPLDLLDSWYIQHPFQSCSLEKTYIINLWLNYQVYII